MKRPKFITVRWMDHHGSSDTWSDPTEPKDLKPARIESRGWIISENAEMLEISAHRPLDKDDTEWGRPMRIVKSAIFFRSDQRSEERKVKDAAKT